VFLNDTFIRTTTYAQLYTQLNVDKVFIGKGRFVFENEIEKETIEAGSELVLCTTKQPSVSTSKIIEEIIARHTN
jgi:hypothetical protein